MKKKQNNKKNKEKIIKHCLCVGECLRLTMRMHRPAGMAYNEHQPAHCNLFERRPLECDCCSLN